MAGNSSLWERSFALGGKPVDKLTERGMGHRPSKHKIADAASLRQRAATVKNKETKAALIQQAAALDLAA